MTAVATSCMKCRSWLVKITVDPAAVAGLLDRDAYISLTGGAE